MKLKNTKKRFLAALFVAGLIGTVAFAHGVKVITDLNGIVVNDVRNKNYKGIVNISNNTGHDVSVEVNFLSGDASLGKGSGFIKIGDSANIEVNAYYANGVTILVEEK